MECMGLAVGTPQYRPGAGRRLPGTAACAAVRAMHQCCERGARVTSDFRPRPIRDSSDGEASAGLALLVG